MACFHHNRATLPVGCTVCTRRHISRFSIQYDIHICIERLQRKYRQPALRRFLCSRRKHIHICRRTMRQRAIERESVCVAGWLDDDVKCYYVPIYWVLFDENDAKQNFHIFLILFLIKLLFIVPQCQIRLMNKHEWWSYSKKKLATLFLLLFIAHWMLHIAGKQFHGKYNRLCVLWCHSMKTDFN